MAKKILHINFADMKLVCDADGCGWKGKLGSPLSEDTVGTACPNCGSNVLTETDYAAAVKMFNWIDLANKWFGFLGTEKPTGAYKKLSVHHHEGKTTIKEM